jgi:chromate transporter
MARAYEIVVARREPPQGRGGGPTDSGGFVDLSRQLRDDARRLAVRAKVGRRRVHRAAARTSPAGLFLSFLGVGATGFGGGLAVIAQVRSLVVGKRGWLSDREFAEGFALAQSLPGTNAGNAVAYVGLVLHGWKGAAASLVGFVLPSYLMMVGLAILYERVRALPDTERLFHGLNAAVVALVLVTAWRVGRRSIRLRWQTWLALAALAASLAGASTLEIVTAAGIVGVFVAWRTDSRDERIRRIRRLAARRRERQAELEHRGLAGPRAGAVLRSTAFFALAPLLSSLALLVTIGTVFLRIGAATFGGGFVMIPMIEHDVVGTYHWLSHQEFADATALGQITPGPVLITATFVGYRVAGVAGSLVATAAVFLPAFLMTVAAGSSLRRFQANTHVQAFLRGVTPAVVALLVAAAIGIGRAGIHSWVGLTIAAICVVVLLRFNVNAVMVIVGAGVARYLASVWLGA